MNKEEFKEYIEKCGGIQEFVEVREQIMELVCAIDEVIELEAKVDSVEISEKEILNKVYKMVVLMGEHLT